MEATAKLPVIRAVAPRGSGRASPRHSVERSAPDRI